MLLTEIIRLTSGDFPGGKGSFAGISLSAAAIKNAKKLPGDSGKFYTVVNSYYDGAKSVIYLLDNSQVSKMISKGAYKPLRKYNWELKADYERRNREDYNKWSKLPVEPKGKPKVVGLLELKKAGFVPYPNAWQVDLVTVDEDLKGQGYGLALYGLAMSELKMTLVAGPQQTPDGRKMWKKLNSIPGVEVKGLVEVKKDENRDKKLDDIMALGGDMVGSLDKYNFFEFDVVPGKDELAPAIKTSLSKLYGGETNSEIRIIARWKA